MIRGKRELLARCLASGAATFVLRQLPARDSLLVLNYHRIGNRDDDPFDPGVFSATTEQLDEQLGYLRRHVSLVTLEEALAFASGDIRETKARCRVLITFDDGYLDSYRDAYPVLRSHDIQGVFFVPTSLVGSSAIPWCDHVAYIMKSARKRRFHLCYPFNLDVDIDANGLTQSLRAVLGACYRPENTDSARFLDELGEEANGDHPQETQRRFLDWNEASEMLAGGMAFGSHTHSHHVLSQMGPEEQRNELARSRAELQARLGVVIDVVSYPVGLRNSFTAQTLDLAKDVGYRAGFSYYGGTNRRGSTQSLDIRRVGVGDESSTRFQVQAAVCRISGSFWP